MLRGGYRYYSRGVGTIPISFGGFFLLSLTTFCRPVAVSHNSSWAVRCVIWDLTNEAAGVLLISSLPNVVFLKKIAMPASPALVVLVTLLRNVSFLEIAHFFLLGRWFSRKNIMGSCIVGALQVYCLRPLNAPISRPLSHLCRLASL